MGKRVMVGRFHIIRFIERILAAIIGGMIGGMIIYILTNSIN